MHVRLGTLVNKRLINKKNLQICQNKTVRFIKNLDPRSHIGFSELDSSAGGTRLGHLQRRWV